MVKGIIFSLLAAASGWFWWSDQPVTRHEVPPVESLYSAAEAPDQPELGQIHWLRSLDSGLVQSQATGKPVLILFQEVPGCSNCTRFGSNTLSHPLIVEAVEDLFIPVCIFNNKGGADKAALERFGEPSWNNPVVRIVSAQGTDLVPRMPDFRSSLPMVSGMRQALDLCSQHTPQYLKLLEEELAAREAGLETATFKMYCFWSGEGTFGSIPGVIETEPGYQDGHEVVRVQYNARKISHDELEKLTQPKGIQTCSGNSGFRSDREPKYYLSRTDWKAVPMTSLQACRANSLVGASQSPESVLSPRQIAIFKQIGQRQGEKPNLIGTKDLAAAWKSVSR